MEKSSDSIISKNHTGIKNTRTQNSEKGKKAEEQLEEGILLALLEKNYISNWQYEQYSRMKKRGV
ncbi:MAG: hypothetical protein RR364_00655 [Lachnospiraceae bacterium]